MKPKVNTNPGANQFAGVDERILEISRRDGKAVSLLSIAERENGRLEVEVYCADPTVQLRNTAQARELLVELEQYLAGPKFTGLDLDGGRKDWISTSELAGHLQRIEKALQLPE